MWIIWRSYNERLQVLSSELFREYYSSEYFKRKKSMKRHGHNQWMILYRLCFMEANLKKGYAMNRKQIWEVGDYEIKNLKYLTTSKKHYTGPRPPSSEQIKIFREKYRYWLVTEMKMNVMTQLSNENYYFTLCGSRVVLHSQSDNEQKNNTVVTEFSVNEKCMRKVRKRKNNILLS